MELRRHLYSASQSSELFIETEINTISMYIQNIIESYHMNKTDLLNIEINNFQNYIASQYSTETRLNDKRIMSDVFKSISMLKQKDEFLLLNALTDVDFGNSTVLQHQILARVSMFEPQPDEQLIELLGSLLSYLNKKLRSSINIVIQPFRDKIWQYCSYNEISSVKIGFYLLKMLLKKFPFCLESIMPKVQKIICFYIYHNKSEIRDLVLETLKELLEIKINSKPYIPLPLIKGFMMKLTNGSFEFYDGIVKGCEIILDKYPDLIDKFYFTSVDFNELDSNDNKKKISALYLIQFQIRTTPNLFTQKLNCVFFSKMIPLLKKKSPIRNEALIAFGKYIFNRVYTFSTEIPLMLKCKDSILESLESDEAVYAYIALLSTQKKMFQEEAKFIFNHSLSHFLVEAFYYLQTYNPEFQDFIHLNVMSMANKILLNSNIPSAQVAFAFKTLIKLDITNKYLTLPLILQYAKLIFNDSLEIRSILISFLKKYQTKYPSKEIVQILISSICLESNEELRVDILTFLKSFGPDISVLPFLQPLLYDRNSKIRTKSFKYMILMLHFPIVQEIVCNFMSDKIQSIQETTNITKENLFCFLILSREAFSNPRKSYSSIAYSLLSPYSSFLIKRILKETTYLSYSTLEILSNLIMISPKDVDLRLLIYHLNNTLGPHSSQQQIKYGIKLLITSLKVTELSHTIYNEHFFLFFKLLILTKLHSINTFSKYLLEALSTIGPINAIITKETFYGFHKSLNKTLPKNENYIKESGSNNTQEILIFTSFGVCISNILYILSSDSFSTIHSLAMDTLFNILKLFPKIDVIQSTLISRIDFLLKSKSQSTIFSILNNISILLGCLGDDFEPLIKTTVDTICEQWNNMDQTVLLKASRFIMSFLPKQIQPYLKILCTTFVTDLECYPPNVAIAVFTTVQSFEQYITTIDYIVYPAIISWLVSNSDQTVNCIDALTQIQTIFAFGGTDKYYSQIIRAMLQIRTINPSLNDSASLVLTVVSYQIKEQFLPYVDKIRSVFVLTDSNPLYSSIKSLESDNDFSDPVKQICNPEKSPKMPTKIRSNPVREISNYINPSIPSENFDENQWLSWFDEFSSNIIRQCPSRAISLCSSLSERYSPLKDIIVPLGLVFQYVQPFSKQSKEILEKIFLTISKVQNIPKFITRTFLAFFEIMDYLDVKSIIDDDILMEKAISVDLIPQALRSAEKLFINDEAKYIEKLLLINKQLGLSLAVNGVIRYANVNNISISNKFTNISLFDWDKALERYGDNFENIKEKEIINNSIHALYKLYKFNQFSSSQTIEQKKYFDASIYWHLLDIEKFKELSKDFDDNNPKMIFYIIIKKILFVDNKEDLESCFETFRNLAYEHIFPLSSEDYECMFFDFARSSFLFEIESILNVKEIHKSLKNADYYTHNKLERLLELNEDFWNTRFFKLQENTSFLYEILCIRSLFYSSEKLHPNWIHLINIALSEKKIETVQLALHVCNSFSPFEVAYYKAQIEWCKDNHSEAIQSIVSLIDKTPQTLPIYTDIELLAGKWLIIMEKYEDAYKYLKDVANRNTNNDEVYKLWSKINFILSNDYSIESYTIAYFDASYKGLLISSNISFQLKILSILTRCKNNNIYEEFNEKIKTIPEYIWIPVLPQIFARLSFKNHELDQIIKKLICQIGLKYPQSVLYSLLAHSRNNSSLNCQKVANEILDELRSVFPSLVDRFTQFTNEIVRLGNSLLENWLSKLNISLKYYYENNYDKILELLIPLYSSLEKLEPQTFNEFCFINNFQSSLIKAKELLLLYQKTKTIKYLQDSIKIYSFVQVQLSIITNETKLIHLKNISTFLLNFSDKEICVPSTFLYNKPIISIERIDSIIIKSRQKSKRILIIGSDGKKYNYLLKSKDDIHFDEYIMQIFSFINNLVENSNLIMKSQLRLITYKVTPITEKIGLIGWIKNSPTLYKSIRNYRVRKGIDLNFELNSAKQKFGFKRFNELPLEEKVEAYKYGVNTNPVNDLAKLILSYSIDSTQWLQKRTFYTASLAISSMVGYILGLGNRNLQNIMIKTKTCELVHNGFDSCFDITRNRLKYSETVPFRLTKMFINALEATKIEGTFRSCCENIMKLMRHNREQILGLLHAIVFNPFIQINSNQDSSAIFSSLETKLCGRENSSKKITIQTQVDNLIKEAIDYKNLSVMYPGWLPWW